MTASPVPGVDGAFFADGLDLDALLALHLQRPLFIAWATDAEPWTLTLDGDAYALFGELLTRARFAARIRAEVIRAPHRPIGQVTREIDALMKRGR